MKCPRCLAVCLDDDPFCPSCHAPFGGSRDGRAVVVADRQPWAPRIALAGLGVGTVLGPVLGPLTGRSIIQVPSPPPAINPNLLLLTLLGASLGLALGYGVGVALFRPK